MLALSHRWFARSTLLPFFLYPFQFLVPARCPCLVLAARLAQICLWLTSLSSLRCLCFELLKLVPPFLFFLFLPGSAMETTLLPGSFMCASGYPLLRSLLSSILTASLYFPHILAHSFPFTLFYIVSARRLGFPSFWDPCLLFHFWQPPSNVHISTWIPPL